MILKFISLIPINSLRIFLYRKVLGYNIGTGVVIKRSILKAKKVVIGNQVTILARNVISCNELHIGEGSSILERNRITGTTSFIMGKGSRVINDHFIDLSADVTFGNNTWLAGKSSQIWTHGSLHTKTGKDLSVTIGDHVYIGSGVLIAPGVKIAISNLIGLGSVVSTSFLTERTVIAGNPSKVVKEDVDWQKNW